MTENVVRLERDLGPADEALLELGCVSVKGRRVVDWWSGKRCGEYGADCRIGAAYAMEVIAWLVEFGPTTMGGVLTDIAQAQIRRGRCGGVEFGFWSAIEEYLGQGHVECAGGFEARLPADLAAPACAGAEEGGR